MVGSAFPNSYSSGGFAYFFVQTELVYSHVYCNCNFPTVRTVFYLYNHGYTCLISIWHDFFLNFLNVFKKGSTKSISEFGERFRN